MEKWKYFWFALGFLWICTYLFSQNEEYYKVPQPYYHHFDEDNFEIIQHDQKDLKKVEKQKKILFFTPYFSLLDWQFGFGNQPFIDFQCPVTNCFTTNNRSLLGKITLSKGFSLF